MSLMTKKSLLIPFGIMAFVSQSMADTTTTVQGTVFSNEPFAAADVLVVDKQGQQRAIKTDGQGHFSLDATGLEAPLLLSAIDSAPHNGVANTNCLNNDTPRARCMASLLPSLKAGQNTANITPFTDRLVSEVAVKLKYIGPQQWIESGAAAQLQADMLDQPLANFRAGFADALTQAGIKDAPQYNPITAPFDQGVAAILQVINHNRGYDNNSGQSGGTVLTDISFRPIVGLTGSGPYEPFEFSRAQRELKQISAAKTRILIVSDSTAATYEVSRMPRMGWGQVFQQYFQPDSGVVVLNGARSGRSSRDFYNEGWYQQMARFMQPGDYVFIAHGHNDQNCNSARAIRGAADVNNLCTYPNDDQGKKQHPEGQPQRSFQNSLERYVELARQAGATPVLLTPTTRVQNADGKEAFKAGDMRPVISNHFTRQNSEKGYAFTGDYIATVKKTASDNNVPLIDLEKLTLDFVNQHPQDWTSYWLAVDQNDARYPYYKTQTTGTLASPDTTHFQQQGAEEVAGLVINALAQQPQLAALAEKSAPPYQAIVSPTATGGEFSSVGDALKSAPADRSPFVIFLKKGTYSERLVIDRDNVTLRGEQRDTTLIEANTAAGMLDPQGQKWGTSGSSTVLVNAANFTAENLTIRNSFDFPANKAKSDDDPTKLKDSQAVALLLAEKSDKARFKQVRLEGYQDTLYSKTGSRSYFTDCEISGHVDFIFGSGISVFDRCTIIARNRTDIAPPYGYITAPSTLQTSAYGLIFLNSQLVKEPGVPAKSFALGRPWHPTTQFADGRYADPGAVGQAVFINTTMDDHIYGWDKMSGKDKQGEKIWFYPQDSRFFEANSQGAGAEINATRPQLSPEQLTGFSLSAIFPDWTLD